MVRPISIVLLIAVFSSPSPGRLDAAEKLPPPGQAELVRAKAEVRELFEVGAAKTPSEKKALAADMIKTAAETSNDPKAQFTLFLLAADLAAEVGDLQQAFEALDELDQRFEFDASPVRSRCIDTAIKAAGNSLAVRKVIRTALTFAEEAIAAENFVLAGQLTTRLLKKARDRRDRELVQQVTAVRERGSAAYKQYSKVKASIDALDTNPTDPTANLAVGRYLCFVKGDFQKGVPMLALGNDPALKELAVRELKGAEDAAAQLALGDAWWKWAGSAGKDDKLRAQQRAAAWYRQAMPDLTGLAKRKVEKRLEEVSEKEAASEAGTASSPRSRSGKRIVKLIPLIDVGQDVLHGEWSVEGGELKCLTGGLVPKVQIRYQPPEEYDFRIVFSQPNLRNCVLQVMPKAGSLFSWAAGGRDGRLAFGVNRPDRKNPTESRNRGAFVPNRKYESVVKVRNTSVRAYINGRLVAQYKTDYSDLGITNSWYARKIKDKSLLAVGCDDPTTFHVVELTEITGRGKKVRAVQQSPKRSTSR